MQVLIEQGTKEWLDLRKIKITATDACVIMKTSKWKTPLELYEEKTTELPSRNCVNSAMQRGIDLEPIAREEFIKTTGIQVTPKVFVNDWALASLDGISEDGSTIVEIKCPGKKDHCTALEGNIPLHYYPQIQHQLWVTGALNAYYYSFDGKNGVAVKVLRDEDYIHRMICKELEFYMCILNKNPPK